MSDHNPYRVPQLDEIWAVRLPTGQGWVGVVVEARGDRFMLELRKGQVVVFTQDDVRDGVARPSLKSF